MSKFLISTDSCVDLFKSYLEKKQVSCICLKRITNGVESAELYDSAEEYRKFYEEIRSGALPTTSQINPFDFEEHFNKILKENKEGDIIHVSLSSGLSETCTNAFTVAKEMNEKLSGRKIFIIDSLSATMGMAMQVERLLELRDKGVSAEEAFNNVIGLRDHQHIWAAVDDLFHLKRGGRLSGFSAAFGTILKVKPILIVNNKGKLSVEKKVRGTSTAIDYILSKVEEYGIKAGADFKKNAIYLVHSEAYENCALLRKAIIEKFGDINIKEGIIGPIIGTHVGEGAIAVVFEGAKRLSI